MAYARPATLTGTSCIGSRCMGVDHGGTCPPEFGVGDANANCPPQILSYSLGTKMSVLWPSKYAKIRFRPGLCPGPRWGGLRRTLPTSPSRRQGKRHPHTPHQLAPTHLRRWPCVPQNSSQIRLWVDGWCGSGKG